MSFDDLGKKTIAEDAPTGSDVSGDPLYDQLSAEIKKLSSPTAEGAIDWSTIEQLAGEILATRSKHILVACCFAIARQHTSGWHGYAEGATVLRDLLITYWDNCFPVKKRMRGRKNAIEWWQEMTDGLIRTSAVEEWLPDERANLLETLGDIDRFLAEKMDDGPLLRPTIQALSSHITETLVAEPPQPQPGSPSDSADSQNETPAQPQTQTAQAPQVPQAQEASQSTSAQQAESAEPAVEQSPKQPSPQQSSPATPQQHAVPAPSDELPPEKNLDLACDYLRLVSNQFLQSDPYHPLAFRLNRIIAWFPLDVLPLSDKGTTMVPPPDSYKISALQNLSAAANWSGLLEAAEQQVIQYLFWLDLHRYVATALERLNQDLAREGVISETRLIIKRLPGLEKLSFSDGTPFADEATRDWLKELEKAGQSGSGQISQTDQSDDAMAELLIKAQTLATGNKLGEALQTLQQGSVRSPSGRSRLQWNLATCQLLCRSGQPLLAAPLATTILEQLDRYGLEQWEPTLAEDALVTVHQVIRLQEKTDQTAKRMEAVLNRLTVLNPARALDLM